MAPATAERLVDGRDIAAVLRGRQQRAGRFVVVHVRRGSSDRPPRIAVVASRRVGNAVTRNRAKRVLREAAREVPWRRATDIVLVARASCATSTTPTVRAELERLAGELKAVAPTSSSNASDAVALTSETRTARVSGVVETPRVRNRMSVTGVGARSLSGAG